IERQRILDTEPLSCFIIGRTDLGFDANFFKDPPFCFRLAIRPQRPQMPLRPLRVFEARDLPQLAAALEGPGEECGSEVVCCQSLMLEMPPPRENHRNAVL